MLDYVTVRVIKFSIIVIIIIRVSALCFLQCYDTVGSVTRTVPGPQEQPVPFIPKGSFSEQVEVENSGTETVEVTSLRRTLASSPPSECASCCHRGHASSNTLLQEDPSVPSWGCRLSQVVGQ